MAPNFFIIGAAKAGTTSLYHVLRTHPEVFFPTNKESNYFITEGRPLTHPEPGSEQINRMSIHEYDRYRDAYAAAKTRWRGDASPSYLYYPSAAARIHGFAPQSKILVVLRDPVERAYSAYLHMRAQGAEEAPTFEDALRLEQQHINDGWWFVSHYIAASQYGEQLARYYQLFPHHQILVLKYEDLARNPADLFGRIAKFLEIDPNALDLSTVRFNETFELRSQLARDILIQRKYGIETFKKVLPDTYRAVLSAKLKRLLSKPKEGLPRDGYNRLLPLVEEDLRLLESVTKMDFGHWKRPR